MWLIKIFIFLNIILGYVNTFARSDFLNIIMPSVILVIFYTSLNKNVIGFLQIFIFAVLGTIVYDTIWFLLSSFVFNLILFI